jgi:D-alanine-D-alanine ligase
MKKIIVLRGGPSSEHEVSLKSGKSVINQLQDNYKITDIVIDKEGNWVASGIIVEPHKITRDIDCVFNAMHGEYGEDGTVQKLLEQLKVPYTGSSVLGSAVAMNKAMAKEIYKQHGIKTPIHKVINKTDNVDGVAMDLYKSFPMPAVLKPVSSGSSVGVSITRDYKSLRETLISLFLRYEKVLIEEYIEGKEATVGIIEEFRDQKLYALPSVEIRKPADRDFFDYDAKYNDISQELCPGEFSPAEKELMQKMAIKSHQELGLRHYSRTDFRIHPKRGIYALETNSLPGLTGQSLMPKSLETVGIQYKEMLEHIINLAINQK